LLLEHLDASITVLGDSDVEGTSANDLVVEFTLSVGSGFLGFEDDETITLGSAGIGEAGDGAGGDGAVGAKELTEHVVSHGVIEVLDVQVLALVLDESLLSGKSAPSWFERGRSRACGPWHRVRGLPFRGGLR
jgi:hypothetical protein